MSNKFYDTLKWIALIFLPALGTLYFAIAGIWGFPYAEQVVGTITAIDTFIGVIIGISSAQYNKTLTYTSYDNAVKEHGEPNGEISEVTEAYPEG